MPLKVLLADDNITAQRMGCKILSDAGYIVVPVSNGAAAVKKIASEKPGLIILDVYMPGYTGLEVCDKVKNAAETARVPVLLTITNMEPFNSEDGNRVKADGVLIKPFEATDLLAVVRKLEGKLHPAAPPEAEIRTKMPAVQEFSDQSYADWKAEVGLEDEAEAKPGEMSHDFASEPVLGIEGLTPAPEAPPAMAVESSLAPFAVESPPVEAPVFDLNAPAPEFDWQHAEAAPEAAPEIAPPAELESTSAPQTGEVEVAPAAEFEPTSQAGADDDVPVVQDSALASDPSDFAQFATKFGQEHPEDIPVGIAMEMEEEQPAHGDAIAQIHEFVNETAPVVEASSVEQEMRHAFETSDGAAVAVAPASEPGPEAEVGVDTQPLDIFPEPQPAPAAEIEAAPGPEHAPGEITSKLVAQFAAELEAAQREAPPEPLPDMEPPAAAAAAPATSMDEQQIAEAVERVLERYKGELIAAIVEELKT